MKLPKVRAIESLLQTNAKSDLTYDELRELFGVEDVSGLRTIQKPGYMIQPYMMILTMGKV